MTTHAHTEYSEHNGAFRCSCGAIRQGWGEDKTWINDGTRACAACGSPAVQETDRCEWHKLIEGN